MGSRSVNGCAEHHKKMKASQAQKGYNLNESFKFILRSNPTDLIK